MSGPYAPERHEVETPVRCSVCGKQAWGEVDGDTCPECEETEEEEEDDG